MPSANSMPQERNILLLCHDWGETADVVANINKSLATHLATFKGVNVASTILCDADSISMDTHKDVFDKKVKIITPTETPGPTLGERIKAFNRDPFSLFPNIARHMPYVTHLIAHSPFTADAAFLLRQQIYPEAQIILMYHCIPDEIENLGKNLPFEVPTNEELVHLAEEADVVYSVSEKIYLYYAAKFRNHAQANVDHRLFIPLCPPQFFNIKRPSIPLVGVSPRILTLAYSENGFEWDGVDIAACAVNKISLTSTESPTLVIGYRLESQLEPLKEFVSKFVTCPQLQVEYHCHSRSMADLIRDLEECAMCLCPSRLEPHGSAGRMALSAGVPSLFADHCNLTALLERLSSEPEEQLVQVTKLTTGVRQDASVWRDRIKAFLKDMERVQRQATALQHALRRDERSRDTHDNVTAFCLGGIRLTFQATGVKFHIGGPDESKETPLLRKINAFLTDVIRYSWRLKYNPLTLEQDVKDQYHFPIPLESFTKNVTNRIEGKDRRIVGFNRKTGAFIVYCPTPESLSDIWAMCDMINYALHRELFNEEDDENRILMELEIKSAKTKSMISGPEFLQYKLALVKNIRPKTAAF